MFSCFWLGKRPLLATGAAADRRRGNWCRGRHESPRRLMRALPWKLARPGSVHPLHLFFAESFVAAQGRGQIVQRIGGFDGAQGIAISNAFDLREWDHGASAALDAPEITSPAPGEDGVWRADAKQAGRVRRGEQPVGIQGCHGMVQFPQHGSQVARACRLPRPFQLGAEHLDSSVHRPVLLLALLPIYGFPANPSIAAISEVRISKLSDERQATAQETTGGGGQQSTLTAQCSRASG